MVRKRCTDSYETRALKIVLMCSEEGGYEESGQLMAALLDFHKHLFFRVGGDYPGLFFRVVWRIYHSAKKIQVGDCECGLLGQT